jgi:hypothetical protein
MKLWDTETGQCLNRFSNGKIPYVIRFHPDDDKQNIFLAGMSDKKIVQVRSSAHIASESTTTDPPSMTSGREKSHKSTISI